MMPLTGLKAIRKSNTLSGRRKRVHSEVTESADPSARGKRKKLEQNLDDKENSMPCYQVKPLPDDSFGFASTSTLTSKFSIVSMVKHS